MPRVTVGLPVYNGERYLRETLDSWLAQSMNDFELLVSDNASSDATPEIACEYAMRDSRVTHLRREEHVIAFENYNGVAQEVSSPFFCWSADDDLRRADFLRNLLEALERNPNAVLAYAWPAYFGDPVFTRKYKRPQRKRLVERRPGGEPSAFRRVRALVRTRAWIAVYGVVRTEALRETRLFHWPKEIPSDSGLLFELAALGELHCVPEPLISIRLHGDSLGRSGRDELGLDPSGKHLDAAAIEFLNDLPLSAVERRLVLREVEVWCRRTRLPRRFLWRNAGFRSVYARTSRALIDAAARLHEL